MKQNNNACLMHCPEEFHTSLVTLRFDDTLIALESIIQSKDKTGRMGLVELAVAVNSCND
ncbi:hypothetical protein T05_9407 [Trichinella murrelli]|uniref:Uncharacterized protein n=1 Tax=Trichinella murrelli TaxID=144512 RepID=A0A0V0TXB6_9BILA|nr:hypothetical protein T05_9407 [Trichinella murrelli]